MNILIFFISDSYHPYDEEAQGFYKYVLKQY